MGASGRVLLGPTDLIDRAMRDGEVNLVGGRARFLGTEPEIAEQGLGDPVMTLVLLQRAVSPFRQSTLPTEARDQPEILEGPQVGQGGRRPHPHSGRDLLQARASDGALPSGDDPERLDLPMGQLLERLHDENMVSMVYMGHPNY